MTAPNLHKSTREERIALVREQWECLDHCPNCDKCFILKGRDAEDLYTEYIEGKRSYIEITKQIRR